MGWLTYLVLIGTPIVYYLIKEGLNWNIYSFFTAIFGVELMTILTWMLIIILSIFDMHESDYSIVTEYKEYNIVSATQTDKIEGRIYLCGGYIEEKPVYKAYKINDDGSLIMVSMYASTTKIIESDDVIPHIKEYTKGEYKLKWGWWRKAVFGGTEGKIYKNFSSADLGHTGIIYIPKGTIKPTFDGMNF